MAHLATQVHFWPRIQDNSVPLFPLMTFAKFTPKISFYPETNLSLWVVRVRGLQTRMGTVEFLAQILVQFSDFWIFF